MIEVEAGEAVGSKDDLRPDLAILIGGACVIRVIAAVAGRHCFDRARDFDDRRS